MDPDLPSDEGDSSVERLVHRAVGGDEQALTALLENLGLQLQRELEQQISAQYRGLVEAEDVLQVTCLEAFLRIRTFVPRGPDSFMAWLRRGAENNLRDAIRKLEREKRPPPGKRVLAANAEESYVALVERIAATTSTPSRAFARKEIRQEIDSRLKQLPPDYEQALRLYELEGLSAPEVAERMGRSHGAVRMLLARAREHLAELLLGVQSRF